MASTIKLKNGSGAPTSGQLVQGEPALDLTNKRLYTENASGTVIEVGINPSSLTTASADINGGTIDGTVIGGSSAAAGSFTTLTTSGNAGIGTTSPSTHLDVTGGTTNQVAIFRSSDATATIGFADNTTPLTGNLSYVTVGAVGNNMVFNTNLAEAMRIDSSGNVGIGTSSPAYKLDVINSVVARYADGNPYHGVLRNDVASGGNTVLEARGISSSILFNTSDASNVSAERMRIDSAGNVGIGTSSPTRKLTIYDTSSASMRLDGGVNGGYIEFKNAASADLAYIGNEKSIIGTGSTNDLMLYTSGTAEIAMRTNGTERARIDSSGNLLVGTTNTAPASSGNVAGSSLLAIGKAEHSRDGGVVLALNRKTSDGDIVDFRKDGTNVGSIATSSGRIAICSGDRGLAISGATDAIFPTDGTGNASTNEISIGTSGLPFKDLYLSGGVYLGGTGAANHLDDYEEGTWTPTVVGSTTAGTYTLVNVTGNYTKVGNLVTCWTDFSFLAASGGSGYIKVGGLPFNYANNADIVGNAHVFSLDVAATSGLGIVVANVSSSSLDEVYLALNKDNASPEQISITGVTTNTRIFLQFSYRA